jgi:long-chain acyl-CoA synthetase
VISAEGSLTFAAMGAATTAVAQGLVGAGIEPGERVAVLLPNGIPYFHAYFATALAGGICVPVNTFLAPAEAATVLEDSDAAALITTGQRLGALAKRLERADSLRLVILVGGEEAPQPDLARRVRLLPWKELPAQGRDARLPPLPRSADLALLTYTSGTTGRIKGVRLTHGNLLANARSCLEAVEVRPKDRLLLFLPMFHSLTQMVCMIAPRLAALTVVLLPGVDRAAIGEAIRRYRPTIFVAVPAVYAAMAERPPGFFARLLNPVRVYLSGASPLPSQVLRRFEKGWRRPLCEGYGLSEASPAVSLNPVSGERRPGSVGLSVPGVITRILREDGSEAPPGEVGEITVEGANVMAGYHHRPEETAAALRDGRLHTGDLGRMDADGYLYVVGRSKEMLIFRGMNIYPREIEEVLIEHPGVAEAAVVGIEDAQRGEIPYAAVALGPGGAASGRQLRDHCRERLARYKVPRSVLVLDMLPRGATGKILKDQVRRLILARREESGVSPPAEEDPPDT